MNSIRLISWAVSRARTARRSGWGDLSGARHAAAPLGRSVSRQLGAGAGAVWRRV